MKCDKAGVTVTLEPVDPCGDPIIQYHHPTFSQPAPLPSKSAPEYVVYPIYVSAPEGRKFRLRHTFSDQFKTFSAQGVKLVISIGHHEPDDSVTEHTQARWIHEQKLFGDHILEEFERWEADTEVPALPFYLPSPSASSTALRYWPTDALEMYRAPKGCIAVYVVRGNLAGNPKHDDPQPVERGLGSTDPPEKVWYGQGSNVIRWEWFEDSQNAEAVPIVFLITNIAPESLSRCRFKPLLDQPGIEKASQQPANEMGEVPSRKRPRADMLGASYLSQPEAQRREVPHLPNHPRRYDRSSRNHGRTEVLSASYEEARQGIDRRPLTLATNKQPDRYEWTPRQMDPSSEYAEDGASDEEEDVRLPSRKRRLCRGLRRRIAQEQDEDHVAEEAQQQATPAPSTISAPVPMSGETLPTRAASGVSQDPVNGMPAPTPQAIPLANTAQPSQTAPADQPKIKVEIDLTADEPDLIATSSAPPSRACSRPAEPLPPTATIDISGMNKAGLELLLEEIDADREIHLFGKAEQYKDMAVLKWNRKKLEVRRRLMEIVAE